MLDIFAEYATDPTLEIQGVWQSLNGAQFLVARAGNPHYSKLLNKRIEEHKGTLDSDDPIASAAKSDEIMAEVFAYTILLDWKDVGYRGAEVPYSKAMAQKLLMHNDFRSAIAGLANKFEAYKVKQEEEQGKA